jgi:hypothetical protein
MNYLTVSPLNVLFFILGFCFYDIFSSLFYCDYFSSMVLFSNLGIEQSHGGRDRMLESRRIQYCQIQE